jgi:WhiB family redox-sensing transcriptional regulator
VNTWQDDARCATVGTEIFFPEGNPADVSNGYTLAKTVCAHCTVRSLCLETALAAEGPSGPGRRSGIWGGKTPAERYEIARRRHTGRPLHPRTQAVIKLIAAGQTPTSISKRLGIDYRTVKNIRDRAAA